MQTQHRLSDWTLAVMCPMANEETSAETVVRNFLAAAHPFKAVTFWAIFDRACTDGSIDILKEYAKTESRLKVIYLENSRGQVQAYLNGYDIMLRQTDADWILEVDAGLSHRAEDLQNFFPGMLSDARAVFATRFSEGGGSHDCSLWRRTVSRGGTFLSNLLLGTRLTDMTSGYQMFSREALQYVIDKGIQSRGHFFQTEMKAYCHHFPIAEAPIVYRGASSVVGTKILKDAFYHLLRLFMLRIQGRLFSI